jgi:prepilin-type N-terminal cleavage/methylation domain-containing protein
MLSMRGFSAVEILLAITLLGVLAVAAIYSITSTGDVSLNAAAVQVRSAIEYAQQNAMTTGQTSGVTFINNGAYTVYQGTVSTPIANPLTRENMVVTLSVSYPGVNISGNYTVEFDSMGRPTTGEGGSITLVLGSHSKIISVTSNTGRVTIQ